MADPRPPHSGDAEQQVIGAILKDPAVLSEVMGLLPTENIFYYPRHQLIYGSILILSEAREPVDITTVADELTKCGKLAECGGRAYLIDTVNKMTTTDHAEAHANIVSQKAQYRRMIKMAQDTIAVCYSQSQPPETLVADLSQQLASGLSLRKARDSQQISTYAVPVLKQCEDIQKGEKTQGILWGFWDLDHLTAGGQKGELTVVSGRPRMGKTSFIQCAAGHQAEKGHRVAVFSAETKGTEWVLRTLCTLGKIDSMGLKRGTPTDQDWISLTRESGTIQKWDYWLNDTPEIDIHDLILQSIRLYNDMGVEIIYVDYLQKLSCRGEFKDERLKFNYMIRKLKRLAQDLNIPVVVACQLNRNLEYRQNKRPNLGDLKETGAIEEEADLIGALHRPSLYIKKKGKGEAASVNLCEWIILKQRNGPVDIVNLSYNPKFTRFEDMNVAQEHMPF